jgi:hypothetical protein
MAARKHPPGEPMTLGNMRRLTDWLSHGGINGI